MSSKPAVRRREVEAVLRVIRLAGADGLTSRQAKDAAQAHLGYDGESRWISTRAVNVVIECLMAAGLVRQGEFHVARALPPLPGDEGALLDAVCDDVGRVKQIRFAKPSKTAWMATAFPDAE